MFQFEFPAELLKARLNGPEAAPSLTQPPEMTTDRAFLYPLCSLRVTFYYVSDIYIGNIISQGRGLPACMCHGSFAGSSGGENSPGPP